MANIDDSQVASFAASSASEYRFLSLQFQVQIGRWVSAAMGGDKGGADFMDVNMEGLQIRDEGGEQMSGKMRN
ncbi:hypothetical protein L1987_00453 [Smallanthus sonchifolius]|uniref:Uncharacterized protein n=1 Tax=Smallanthus sonchifolius TaxID=185202 RepID=A0ACB9K2I1_9ASTR|nr:hypothetical protein L1987_00453 [Smallanthus sonchifolius]